MQYMCARTRVSVIYVIMHKILQFSEVSVNICHTYVINFIINKKLCVKWVEIYFKICAYKHKFMLFKIGGKKLIGKLIFFRSDYFVT